MPVTGTGQGTSDEITQAAPDDALVQDATVWVGQLLRTLKTCRLYDEANPTVVRFREGLASSLLALLGRHGALRLEVTSNSLSLAAQPVHTARSREDNLAGILHRDGIRLLTLEPGIEAREVDSMVDQILKISGPSAGDDDLVTLLWDAELPHVLVEMVPLEGEADGGAEDGELEESRMAWPKQGAGAGRTALGDPASAQASRSDDWTTPEGSSDLEQAFDDLENMALFEIARFQAEYEQSVDEHIVTETLLVLNDCCASELSAEDKEALAEFIPRVLREALALGDWRTTSRALRLLRGCDPDWRVQDFSTNLCGPFAITTRKVVEALDRGETQGVEGFLALAREFGPPLAEWLMHVLAESQQMRVRRPLARMIAELLADHPEPVVPWLSDPRWYVVRNAVHILGWIGGNAIAPCLRGAAEHAEPRVRREVVAALSQVERSASRPILMNMLKSADVELFGTILHQLTMDHDVSIARMFQDLLRDPSFGSRSAEERRALFMALSTRGDEVLPALETELTKGGLFSRRTDADRQAIALCIARIGTPSARAILERGLGSNLGAVRKACLIAGASGDASRD